MNNFVGIGRITKDLELKQTTSGIANVRFTVAINRAFKGQNGEQQADFINCVAWRAQAENLVKYCGKGSLVAVQGSIQTGSYTDRDGKKVYTTDVVANNIQFLDTKSSTNNGANQQNATGNQYGGNQYGGNQGGYQQQQGMYQQPSYQKSGVSDDPFAQGQQQSNNIEQDLPF